MSGSPLWTWTWDWQIDAFRMIPDPVEVSGSWHGYLWMSLDAWWFQVMDDEGGILSVSQKLRVAVSWACFCWGFQLISCFFFLAGHRNVQPPFWAQGSQENIKMQKCDLEMLQSIKVDFPWNGWETVRMDIRQALQQLSPSKQLGFLGCAEVEPGCGEAGNAWLHIQDARDRSYDGIWWIPMTMPILHHLDHILTNMLGMNVLHITMEEGHVYHTPTSKALCFSSHLPQRDALVTSFHDGNLNCNRYGTPGHVEWLMMRVVVLNSIIAHK